jgi:wyosine [tRNA(Phe)-imidazoG37] synthetase (radical SAM superfamily)
MTEYNHIVFGPVPSRRLGKSIGINNIPPKRCSYSCVYCQIGRTHQMQINRESFYDPDIVFKHSKEKITQLIKNDEHIDYITIVSDGEPTLDKQLGLLIKKLKTLSYPVAVITNSSLIYQKDIQDELAFADLVSLKIDSVSESIWKQVDRPYGSLNLDEILRGIMIFSAQYDKILYTETMLIHQINDTSSELEKIAEFIARVKPAKSFLSIPTRPPSEPWVQPASEEALAQAYQLFNDHHIPTEYLMSYEGNEFAYSGNAEQELLSILSVHPMRKEAVDHFLKKANETWSLIERLIKNQQIVKHRLGDHTYFSKKLSKR